MTISGYLSASFDLFNIADLDVIAQARARCERLTVGVFSDEWVNRVEGRAPIVPLEERVALLRHVRGVDDVVVHDDTDLESLGPECLLFAVRETTPTPVEAVGEIIWIDPGRRTESQVLREALQPDEESAVA